MTRSSGAVGCADDEVVSKPANKEGQWRVLAIRPLASSCQAESLASSSHIDSCAVVPSHGRTRI